MITGASFYLSMKIWNAKNVNLKRWQKQLVFPHFLKFLYLNLKNADHLKLKVIFNYKLETMIKNYPNLFRINWQESLAERPNHQTILLIFYLKDYGQWIWKENVEKSQIWMKNSSFAKLIYCFTCLILQKMNNKFKHIKSRVILKMWKWDSMIFLIQ